MTSHKINLCWILTVLMLSSCGKDPDLGTSPSSSVYDVRISPLTNLIVGIGNTISFSATPVDSSNQPLTVGIEWTVLNPTIVTIDGNGVATSLKAGTTTVIAKAGNQEATAVVEVWDAPPLDTYTSGEIYQGRNGYVEYIPGDLPLILSAPHGGNICPDEIVDRTYGSIGSCSSTGSDTNTDPLTRTVRNAFLQATGRAPHIIILKLARPKLDANRDVTEAAQGNLFAKNTWSEYHGFIDVAKDTISKEFGFGLYMDMHGHGHSVPRIELGYLLSKTDLQTINLDLTYMINKSSVKRLASVSGIDFTDLIRGPQSIGGLLEQLGIRAVPSDPDPAPVGDEKFFSGGYSTRRHGSRDGGLIDGIQFEHHFTGLRDMPSNRLLYANVLIQVLRTFLDVHYGWSIPAS